MRVLGVDWGSKRIGLAVGEQGFGITRGLPNVDASGALARDAAEINRIAKIELCDAIVVGLPLEADGTPSEMAKICLQLVERLRELGSSVFTVDESLSSVEVESDMMQAGLKGSQRRKRKDAAAAQVILERFINEQR